MGTFDISTFQNIVRTLKRRYGKCKVAIETGTCLGYGTKTLSKAFDKVHTIEIMPDLHYRTKHKLMIEGYINVDFYLGDSAIVLRDILEKDPTTSYVFFLDAHWSGDNTTDWNNSGWKGYGTETGYRGEKTATPTSEQQIPLLDELKAIMELTQNECVVVIDDMKAFDDKTGEGKKDLGFKGEDWSAFSRTGMIDTVKSRLDSWIEYDINDNPMDRQLILFLKPQYTVTEAIACGAMAAGGVASGVITGGVSTAVTAVPAAIVAGEIAVASGVASSSSGST